MQALRLVKTNELSRDEWLEWRRKGIGGSDVSAICNMNRYRSPMAVYLDKIGELPPIEENESMYWGNRLEDIVADEFSVRTNLRVRRDNKILQHPDYPFMLANIDRWVIGTNAGLECKTANEYAKDDWNGEQVPKEYALQCHHYMAVTGADRWYCAVLIGGNKYEWRVIERDEEIIKDLIEIESNFWNNHVLKKVPPAFSAHDDGLLREMYPQSKAAEEIDLSDHQKEVNRLLEARDGLKDAEFEFEDSRAVVMGLMGEAELGYFNDQLLFTWKSNSRSRPFKFVGGKD